jgi:Ca-activated chloride channel family protein
VPAHTQVFDGFGGTPQSVAGKVVAPPLKADRLQSLATAGHGLYVEANYTDSDTRAILGGLEASSAKNQLSPESARVWDERFYLPALALALLLLALFRRGASFPAIVLLATLFFWAPPSYAAPLADLFLNRDQQALVAYDKGDFKDAMTKFDTPYRRGIAAYRAGAYDKAASLFKIAASQKDGLNALYDLGNAQLMQGQVEDAIASYETVLKQKPGHVGARHNLAIALKMLAQNRDDNKKQNNQDKKNQGKSKQDQNKQQGRQQPQQQNKNGQRGSQSPQGGAQKPAQAKQAKDNQQAKQQQRGSQGKPQQQTGSQQPSPQHAKQVTAGRPQSPLTGASYNAQQRTPRDVNADEWLGRVQSDPGSFLKNQFMIEDRKSGLKQGSPPE